MSAEQAAELPVVAFRYEFVGTYEYPIDPVFVDACDRWENKTDWNEVALTDHATATAQIAALRAELKTARDAALESATRICSNFAAAAASPTELFYDSGTAYECAARIDSARSALSPAMGSSYFEKPFGLWLERTPDPTNFNFTRADKPSETSDADLISSLRAELEKAMEDAYTYTLQMARWFCLNRDANTPLADVFAFYNFAKKVEAAVGQSNPYLAGMEEKFGCVDRGGSL